MTRLAKIWLFSLLGILIIGGVGGAGYFMVKQHIEQEQKKKAAESLDLQQQAVSQLESDFAGITKIKFITSPQKMGSGFTDITAEVTTTDAKSEVIFSISEISPGYAFNGPILKKGSTNGSVDVTYYDVGE